MHEKRLAGKGDLPRGINNVENVTFRRVTSTTVTSSSPLLGQFHKTINPLVLELAIKEMGRDDAKKLPVRNYRKKVVKLGGNRQKTPANPRMREEEGGD